MDERLIELRALGWSVAVHNDYRLHGKPHTFWLLTNPNGRWIKGEGETDVQALDVCIEAARAEVPTRVEGGELVEGKGAVYWAGRFMGLCAVNDALQDALRPLTRACELADAKGDLGEDVDGTLLDAANAALTVANSTFPVDALPPSPAVDREALARIIDPLAFARLAAFKDIGDISHAGAWIVATDNALAKADQIIGLLALSSPDTVEPKT